MKVLLSILVGIVIFDYTLDELLELLKDLDESQIKESRHFIESNIGRNEDIGMVYDLLLNSKPVQLVKQKLEHIKLFMSIQSKNLKIYI